jgi:lipid-A-disaccharide synthase
MNKLVIIAGELSGETHGARLITELHSLEPDLQISGIGGDKMIDAGMQTLYHIREMAFLGLGEIIRHLPFILRVYRRLLSHIKEIRPDAVILIDYPGFNLKVARAVKKLDIPVIYYISPQLWAWGKRRVKKIKRSVDLMLVLFPFEEEFYKQYGIDAHFSGHPLVDRYYHLVKPKHTKDNNQLTLGLLPGSRLQELKLLLPRMIQTAQILFEQGKIKQAFIAAVPHIAESVYRPYLEGKSWCFLKMFPMEQFYNQLDAALVASGTATLETAYFRVPMVIVYRVHPLTWHLGRLLVKLDRIGLANIVAGTQVAPELLQNAFVPRIASELLSGLLTAEKNRQTREKMKIIKEKLGNRGASAETARRIKLFLMGDNAQKNSNSI